MFGKIPILDPNFLVQWTTNMSNKTLKRVNNRISLEIDRINFTDLRSTQIFIRGRVIKGDRTRVDDFKETLLVNNALHSLFSNCEIYLNNDQVHNANSLYAHHAFVAAEFSGTKGAKGSFSKCQGYQNEVELNDFRKRPYPDTVFQKEKDEFILHGPLAIERFACKTWLLSNVNLRLKVIRLSPAFNMIDNAGWTPGIDFGGLSL